MLLVVLDQEFLGTNDVVFLDGAGVSGGRASRCASGMMELLVFWFRSF